MFRALTRVCPIAIYGVLLPLLGIGPQLAAQGSNRISESAPVPELAAPKPAAPKPAASELSASDPAVIEPGEDLPGGAATSRRPFINRNAFSQFSGNLDARGQFRFRIGNAVFRKLWVSAPSSTTSSDGLGPLFNARSCQRCHIKDGRGHPPNANAPRDNAISMVLHLSILPQTKAQKALLASNRVTVIPEPRYGRQLQDFAIQGHAREGLPHISYQPQTVTLSGGETVTLRRPGYHIVGLQYGPLHKDVRLSPRIAPQMIGLGLLDSVSEVQIMALADPDDRDGDGISGRPNRVWSLAQNAVVLGKFGWKAGSPTVRQQVAEAFATDIGISSSLKDKPSGDCTLAQQLCLAAPNGNSTRQGGLEIGDKLLAFVSFYSSNLAVPQRRDARGRDVLRGKALFNSVGCGACHRPRFATSDVAAGPHLQQQVIWPYTDLLLHDMGEGLSDGRREGRAGPREWRTAPLWGIGLTQTVSGHEFFLHDGRARGITEAILWHGGEGRQAREAFAALPRADRELLIKFVKSL